MNESNFLQPEYPVPWLKLQMLTHNCNIATTTIKKFPKFCPLRKHCVVYYTQRVKSSRNLFKCNNWTRIKLTNLFSIKILSFCNNSLATTLLRWYSFQKHFWNSFCDLYFNFFVAFCLTTSAVVNLSPFYLAIITN